jgi:hypothetical protein
MKLNEIIEIEGLEGVSEKTNISIYNLNSLLNRDFSELNRVKALGFVHILKREYDADVDELERSIRSYFADNTPIDDEPVLVKPDKLKQNSGFSKWIVLLILLGGLWYLYNSGKINEILSSNSHKEDSLLDDTKALKSGIDISEDEVKKDVIIRKDNNETKVEIKTPPLVTTGGGDINGTQDVNGTKKIKIIADIPKESNGTKDGNQTVIVVNSEAGIEEPVANTPEPDSNATEITNVTINPTRGMLWYGFINIETRKHKEFMRKESTPFELKGGKWILTTGHGYLDIVSDIKTIELADRKRHYFYIDSKEIKEITRREFKKLNHGRIW